MSEQTDTTPTTTQPPSIINLGQTTSSAPTRVTKMADFAKQVDARINQDFVQRVQALQEKYNLMFGPNELDVQDRVASLSTKAGSVMDLFVIERDALNAMAATAGKPDLIKLDLPPGFSFTKQSDGSVVVAKTN